MINLLLIRTNVHDKKPYTTGHLFNRDTGEFLMHTLEPEVRDINADGNLLDAGEQKVWGKTAIPYGTYKGFLRYSPKRDRVVPELTGVKHFANIQFHAGNMVTDSDGCILVGHKAYGNSIWESMQAERDLVRLIEEHEGKFTVKIV